MNPLDLILNPDFRSNYHTHTLYCDGEDRPAALAAEAFARGFRALGFSGHEWSEPDYDYAMTAENEARYRTEIRDLQAQYAGRMEIFCGAERDYFSPRREEAFDYLIGSCHHLEKGGVIIDIDNTPELFAAGIREQFAGDGMELARAYFRQEAGVLRQTGAGIVGHFDIVTKFNGPGLDDEKGLWFDERDPVYRRAALEAVHEIVETFVAEKRCQPARDGAEPALIKAALAAGKPIFEVNTGAMARGRRKVPYPAPFILAELVRMEVPLLLSSDCHQKELLTYGFPEAVRFILDAAH